MPLKFRCKSIECSAMSYCTQHSLQFILHFLSTQPREHSLSPTCIWIPPMKRVGVMLLIEFAIHRVITRCRKFELRFVRPPVESVIPSLSVEVIGRFCLKFLILISKFLDKLHFHLAFVPFFKCLVNHMPVCRKPYGAQFPF